MSRRTILLFILCPLLVACAAGGPSQPTPTAADVRWNTDPSAKVVMLYSPHTTAGLSGAYDDRYYIPEVQIWGDGRILWVTQEGQRRRVLEGQLTTEEMEALLRRFVDARFFGWEDEYYTPGGHSLPRMYLQVNLADRTKEISEHGGAPEAYYDLEELLLSGAGAQGHDYVPARGYLSARPFSAEGTGPAWPEGADVTPEDLLEGATVEEEILEYAWELVNRNPTSPVYVSCEGQTYVIMVQIPGVSYFEPPS